MAAKQPSAPNPIPMPNPAPAAPTAPAGQASADAFLNLGRGPFASEGAVTAGNARPWSDSPWVARLYGGTPNPQQQADFQAQVIDRVTRTFGLSGVPINLTGDPGVAATRSLSVVSGTYSPLSPNALGMSQVGGDGFTFIDQAAKVANNVDQLSWIVAHNVSHELMHAFGVKAGQGDTGQTIDSPVASWGMLVNPNATFSASAARELLQKDFNDRSIGLSLGSQVMEPSPVPEPATLASWIAAIMALGLARARAAKKRFRFE